MITQRKSHRPASPAARRAEAGSRLALLLLALVSAGCNDLFVPDFNNPGLGDLENDPTRQIVASSATGLLISSRDDYADYVLDLGILGREALNLDPSDPRWVTELLIQPLDPGSGAFGGDHWLQEYATIRNANLILNAVEKVPTTAEPSPTTMTEQEKQAVRGFAKTLQALAFLLVINTRDTNGAPIDVNRPVGDLAPIESKEAVFAHISSLLDQGRDHLAAAGEAFPFALSSGYAGFDTPQTFLRFNRALKARVEVYRMNYAAALEALGASFLVDCGSFELGVYQTYSTASGDELNEIFEDPATADVRAHPSLRTLAQLQPTGEPDRRFLEKTLEAAPRENLNHASDLTFTIYEGPTAPIPIIRNEELILLRAEANIGLGDLAAAEQDINCIRENVGGLAPVELTAANALDELLYNKLFSLLFEGGHRWVDMRRYGRLDQLPLDQPGDVVHTRYPIPTDEVLARE